MGSCQAPVAEDASVVTPDSSAPKPLSLWTPLLKLALGILLVAGLVWSQRAELRTLLHQPPALPWLAISFGAIVVSELLGMLRWYILLRAQAVPCSFGDVIRLGYVGLFFNMFLPGAVGGDILRAVYLGQTPGYRARVVLTVVLDRVFGLLSLGCLAALGVCLRWPFWPMVWQRFLWPAAGGVLWLALVTGLVWRSGVLHRSRFGTLAKRWGAPWVSQFAGGRAWGWILTCLALSLVSQFVAVGAFRAVLHACRGHDPGTAVLIYVCPIAWLAGSLPITPGGLGLTEGAYQALLGGSGQGPVLGVALTYRVCVALTTLAGLFFYLTHRHRGQKSGEAETTAAPMPASEMSRAA